jgi:uncharacterized membrane protein YccF (DUF307 family)
LFLSLTIAGFRRIGFLGAFRDYSNGQQVQWGIGLGRLPPTPRLAQLWAGSAAIRFDCPAYRHKIGSIIPRQRAPLQLRSNRMPPVSIFLNILWILLGGLWMAAAWVVAGVIMAITIIGLPWARAAFNIAVYTLLPFGQKAVRRDSLTGYSDIGTGPLGLIGNLIWLVLAGWWLALAHIITAVVLAVTIIGIPFAWAHLKLAGIALWPIGKVIVPA